MHLPAMCHIESSPPKKRFKYAQRRLDTADPPINPVRFYL